MSNRSVEKYETIKNQLLKSLSFDAELLTVFESKELTEKDSPGYPSFSAKLSELLLLNLDQKERSPFLQEHNNLEELIASLRDYAEKKTAQQINDRFYPVADDHFLVRFRKLGKRFLLQAGWLWVGFSNLFRKAKKNKEFWTHDIPESALAEYVFVIRFCEDLLSFLNQMEQNRENRIRRFYELDRQLEHFQLLGKELADFDESITQLKDELEADRAEIERFFNNEALILDELFKTLWAKTGTFEFPVRKLRQKKLAQRQQKALGKLDQSLSENQLVFFALAEHWRLKLHNRSLIFKLKSQSNEQGAILLDQINQHLKPAFIGLKRELVAFANREVSYWNERKKVLEIKSFVESQMPGLIQLVFQAQLSNLFDRPVVIVENEIGKGPEAYQFAASVFEGKRIRKKAFQSVNTRELLKGSVLLPLKKQFAEDRKKFLGVVQKLTTNLEEIQYSANYSVEFYFSQKKDENATNELVEGLKRTVRRADDSLRFLGSIQELTEDAFSKLTRVFTEQVLLYFEPNQLHQSEKINQRREFVDRRKKQFREALARIGKLWQQYFRKLKALHSVSYNKYFNLRNLLGISYEKEPISTELANYLSETRQAIQRLPLMYQKLFENVPLTEDRFSISRRVEFQKLTDAFDSWKAGRFSPVCVVGEQGSGMTTILNSFTKSIEKEIAVTRVEIKQNIVEEIQLVELLGKAFQNEKFNSIPELIEIISRMDGSRLIVLDNVQNLFLRSSGDFGNLFLLFKLISQTNSKIFWVTSCYLYSWKLLDYTNDIANYFAYVIEFSPLTAEQLREAILKRHQVSGFSLVFQEPENFVSKRNYQKMDDEEKQLFLKDVFFEELGQYAQSNLSLAFLYWLRAIQKVDNGEIFLQQKRLNFSFLNSLETRDLTTLHSILVHGGLDLYAHSRIFRCSSEISFRVLMVLTDDGLLEKNEDVYVINPLVYRMLVSQLKSLNFIY